MVLEMRFNTFGRGRPTPLDRKADAQRIGQWR